MVAMTQERFLTVREIADRMRVTEFTVRNWLRSGKLQGYRPGGTKAGWRVKESDLERFIEGGRGEPAATDPRREMAEHQDALEDARRRIRGEDQN